MNNFLFAIDVTKEEIVVSESPKGSNKVHLIERIHRKDNELLYTAVQTLTGITKATPFDATLFKNMDKVCQTIYAQFKAGTISH